MRSWYSTEHDAKNCTRGIHSDRGRREGWCPVFLEKRRAEQRYRYANLPWVWREADLLRTNANRRRRERRG